MTKYYCIEPNCNNEICYKTWKRGQGKCQSCAWKDNPRYNPERHNKHYCINCGREICYETWKYSKSKCFSCAHKGKRYYSKQNKILTKKFLINEYIKNEKSQSKIGKGIKCSQGTIRNYLIKFNIPIKTRSEACKGKNSPGYIDGRTNRKYCCKICGRKIKWTTALYGTSMCSKCYFKTKKGKNSSGYGKNSLGTWGKYKGINMRSSWEIKFAYFLDLSGIKWKYEPKRFYFKDCSYLPDFYISEWNCYIEIKGFWRDNAKKKFKLFKKLHPKVRIKVLKEKNLKNLGILK